MTDDRQFELVLFDLEGTLVDFQWRLEDAVKELLPVLSKAGIKPSRYGASPSYAGIYNTTRDITRAWDPQKADELFEQLADIYETYDRDALIRWAPYADAQSSLERLSAFKYRMGVVSNCGSHAADTVLERFNLAEFFEIALARNDVLYLKPSPEGLNLALEKLDVPADRTLFVGDSINDILAANKVPMPSCFLSGGESKVTGEDGRMATFQITSLSGLVDMLIP
ncbi:HAD family hydrolase [Desulfobacula sp.]|uniref:HAD family hydrolase n=1 Tax=Desulfobacula sp. TaxID=2593537 RepID=UPI00262832C0|nr:HAD family hydrolase [Desulfobacula sp.]